MKQQSGFTLVELAVVVFLVGLLASLGLSALNAQLASSRISDTKKKQDTIKDALIGYLGKYKRLPCPDSNFTSPDGIENRGVTGTPTTPADPLQVCDKSFGIVPYQTLGLTKSVALDGWENFFSYQVSNDTTTGLNLDWTLNTSFHTGNTGFITVKDRISADITNNAVVVISYGKNGSGAYTSKGTRNALPDSTALPDEYQNSTQLTITIPPTFYNREYTENTAATGGAFDDILMALNPRDLITPLMKDGSLKSAESQWAEQITNINNALIGAMFNDTNCAPPANQTVFSNILVANGIPTVDPWGGALSYAKGDICKLKSNGNYCSVTSGCMTCSAPSTTMIAFTLTTSTTTPTVTIRPQILSTLTANNTALLSGCP